MNRHILNKCILLLCLASNIQFVQNIDWFAITSLIFIAVSSFNSYFDKKYFVLGSFFILIMIGIPFSPFIFLYPLVCYDLFTFGFWPFAFITLIPIINAMDDYTPFCFAHIFAFFAFSFILAYRTKHLNEMEAQFIKMKDSSTELTMLLKDKNKNLLERQDYEIKMATLKERNRIAREIHDNVGHMLSRSILQVGALIAMNKESSSKESLTDLKDTLNTAMNSIRESVHDLHDESVDLKASINEIIDNFRFCDVDLDFSMSNNMEANFKYTFIAIVKEALSNIMKHSNATKVSIHMIEHPALYQILIADNGTNCRSLQIGESGMGLNNIKERVNAMNGNLNITTDKGFQIFLSIPRNIES